MLVDALYHLSLSPTPLADVLDEVGDADSDDNEVEFEVSQGFIISSNPSEESVLDLLVPRENVHADTLVGRKITYK